MAEYLDYLNDLARADPEQARRRAPRPAGDAPTYLRVGADGTLSLPEVDADGDRWDLGWPVFAVSWHDAVDYCRWRSERDGRPYRLPTSVEWEKAARGVDGRWYPWGNDFDPSLCNVRDSTAGRAMPVAVEACPADVSIYGVRGMAGNIQQWTLTDASVGEGPGARPARIHRGGGWFGDAVQARSASRRVSLPANVDVLVGFRLACSLPERRRG
jgi:serine/threonine-protein kinase